MQQVRKEIMFNSYLRFLYKSKIKFVIWSYCLSSQLNNKYVPQVVHFPFFTELRTLWHVKIADTK